jgi:hypothetical protein
MRTLLPPSRTILFLLLVACSDQHATRPDRTAAQQPAGSVGQLSEVAIPQDAPTPPAEMLIGGSALACFGEGCTPSDIATISVAGAGFAYFGRSGDDFLTRTANGVAGANGDANGAFGEITVTTVTGFAPVSIPFTLQLTFSTPAADPVTVTGTVRGSLGPPVSGAFPRGAVILTFDDKKIVGGETLKINFVDQAGIPRRLEVTLPSVLIPADATSMIIGGFFEIR